MTKAEFIKKAVAGDGVMEELDEARGMLDIFVQIDGTQATVKIRRFEELGIHDIVNDYYNAESGFDAYAISNYLDEHTEHDLWDELFEDYQNSIEEA